MSFFGNNKVSIINNLSILNKLYYVSIYVKSITHTDLPNKDILIEIKLYGYCINSNSKTSSASCSISGTSNTTNGISNFYVSLLNQGVNLLYSDFSEIEGFSNCNSSTSITSYDDYNNISLVTRNVMKFKFEILNLATNRQGGQTINAYIEYQYVNYYSNFDYENLRNYVIKVLTSTVDENTFWEYLSIYIAHNALQKFKDIIGISVNLVVLNNPDGQTPEYGNHGPTYVYGIYQ